MRRAAPQLGPCAAMKTSVWSAAFSPDGELVRDRGRRRDGADLGRGERRELETLRGHRLVRTPPSAPTANG